MTALDLPKHDAVDRPDVGEAEHAGPSGPPLPRPRRRRVWVLWAVLGVAVLGGAYAGVPRALLDGADVSDAIDAMTEAPQGASAERAAEIERLALASLAQLGWIARLPGHRDAAERRMRWVASAASRALRGAAAMAPDGGRRALGLAWVLKPDEDFVILEFPPWGMPGDWRQRQVTGEGGGSNIDRLLRAGLLERAAWEAELARPARRHIEAAMAVGRTVQAARALERGGLQRQHCSLVLAAEGLQALADEPHCGSAAAVAGLAEDLDAFGAGTDALGDVAPDDFEGLAALAWRGRWEVVRQSMVGGERSPWPLPGTGRATHAKVAPDGPTALYQTALEEEIVRGGDKPWLAGELARILRLRAEREAIVGRRASARRLLERATALALDDSDCAALAELMAITTGADATIAWIEESELCVGQVPLALQARLLIRAGKLDEALRYVRAVLEHGSPSQREREALQALKFVVGLALGEREGGGEERYEGDARDRIERLWALIGDDEPGWRTPSDLDSDLRWLGDIAPDSEAAAVDTALRIAPAGLGREGLLRALAAQPLPVAGVAEVVRLAVLSGDSAGDAERTRTLARLDRVLARARLRVEEFTRVW